MEGFLMKKGRGESKMFKRRNWKKRWMVLDGQYLTYYEDFDKTKNEPANKKGTAVIRGCIISVVNHQDKKFCFVVSHDTRTPLYLCAESERIMFMWIKALEKAAAGKSGGPVSVNFDEFYEVLDMDKSKPYTTSSLNKSYRKAALRNHPDKGGNVDAFKRVQEAFEILQNKLEEEEQAKLHQDIHYTASVAKGPPGVGFGMVVVEDTKKGAIVAKEILPVMILKELSSEANGKMKAGDRIVKIDSDDITTWTLARVVQRLNDFRAPVGTVVKFTFARRVRIDGTEEEEEAASQEETTPAPPPAAPSDPSTWQQSTAGDDEFDTGLERAGSFIEDRDSGFRDTDFADIDEDDAPPPPSPPISSRVPAASRKSDWGQDPVVQAVSLQAENEELVQKMQELEKELIAMKKERDIFRIEAADWRMKYDVVNGEKLEFLRQLGEAEAECSELERRERNALDLLEQLSDQGHLTPQLTQELEKTVLEAAHVVQSGQMFPNEEGGFAKRGSVEAAIQAARSAASFVDTSGKFVDKMDQTSGSSTFLKRLEDSVLRQYGNSSAYDNGDGSDSDSDGGMEPYQGTATRSSPPYNPSGYVPSGTTRETRATNVQNPMNQKSRQTHNPKTSRTAVHHQQSQSSSVGLPSQRPQSNGRTSQGRGGAVQRNPLDRGSAISRQSSAPRGNTAHSPHQNIHSPIKHTSSYSDPFAQDHHQGPYEYQPPYHARATESSIPAGGALSRERKLNMLSQPTASSRARFSSDAPDSRRSTSRSPRNTDQGMNFGRIR